MRQKKKSSDLFEILSNNENDTLSVPDWLSSKQNSSGVVIVHGEFSKGSFSPFEPLPKIEGPAELIVHSAPKPSPVRKDMSVFDAIAKTEHTRSAEAIDRQLREERDSWDDQ